MPGMRVNCTQCLSVIGLKEQTLRVKQFVAISSGPALSIRMSLPPLPRCRASWEMPPTRRKKSLKLENISSSIPTTQMYPSTNSHSTHGSKTWMGVSSGSFLHRHLLLHDCQCRPSRNDHHLGLVETARNASWNLACLHQFRVGSEGLPDIRDNKI